MPAGLGAGTAPPLEPYPPVVGGVNAALTHTSPILMSEAGIVPQVHGTSRRVWRRDESFIGTLVAAAASVAAISAVAFLVLQCFRAIGKASGGTNSSRRLAYGDAGLKGDNCGLELSTAARRRTEVLSFFGGIESDKKDPFALLDQLMLLHQYTNACAASLLPASKLRRHLLERTPKHHERLQVAYHPSIRKHKSP
ncbi:hypothetical protein Emag_005230 [Eimeria magna]